MLAQATALAFGNSLASSPQGKYDGERSSNLILLNHLDPYHFGMLLSLYEHKVFSQGVLWNINCFDQPGVELGKVMARNLENSKKSDSASATFATDLFEHFVPLSKK
jgi:glucose-6-phosphate isomerase